MRITKEYYRLIDAYTQSEPTEIATLLPQSLPTSPSNSISQVS